MATEKRLIDANRLLELYYMGKELEEYAGVLQVPILVIRQNIKDMPTVDAVEVVRCKDCRYYDNSEGIQWCHLNSKFAQHGTDWHSFPEDGFCSYGERKDNGKSTSAE